MGKYGEDILKRKYTNMVEDRHVKILLDYIVYKDNIIYEFQNITTNKEAQLNTNHKLVTSISKMAQVDTGEIKYEKLNIGKLNNEEIWKKRDRD